MGREAPHCPTAGSWTTYICILTTTINNYKTRRSRARTKPSMEFPGMGRESFFVLLFGSSQCNLSSGTGLQAATQMRSLEFRACALLLLPPRKLLIRYRLVRSFVCSFAPETTEKYELVGVVCFWGHYSVPCLEQR